MGLSAFPWFWILFNRSRLPWITPIAKSPSGNSKGHHSCCSMPSFPPAHCHSSTQWCAWPFWPSSRPTGTWSSIMCSSATGSASQPDSTWRTRFQRQPNQLPQGMVHRQLGQGVQDAGPLVLLQDAPAPRSRTEQCGLRFPCGKASKGWTRQISTWETYKSRLPSNRSQGSTGRKGSRSPGRPSSEEENPQRQVQGHLSVVERRHL